MDCGGGFERGGGKLRIWRDFSGGDLWGSSRVDCGLGCLTEPVFELAVRRMSVIRLWFCMLRFLGELFGSISASRKEGV